MSFGRKGVVAGEAVVQPAPFGRARAARPAERPARTNDPYYGGDLTDAEIAARREAFLASERAAGNIGAASPAMPMALGSLNAPPREGYRAPPISRYGQADTASGTPKKWFFGDPRKRSLLVAYVLWYFCSPIGIHRFYCGAGESAWYQIGCFVGGVVCLLIWPPLGLLLLGAWLLWIIVDLFLMPGMMRRFKAEHDPRSYAGIFD